MLLVEERSLLYLFRPEEKSVTFISCQARYKTREAQSHLAEVVESELLMSNLWQIRSLLVPNFCLLL